MAVISTVLGITLLLLARWAEHTPGGAWTTNLPVTDIGSALFTTGLIAIFFEYIDQQDADERANQRLRTVLAEEAPAIRDAVIQGFAFNADDLAKVANPDVLDRIARNVLSLPLGDRDLAADAYTKTCDSKSSRRRSAGATCRSRLHSPHQIGQKGNTPAPAISPFVSSSSSALAASPNAVSPDDPMASLVGYWGPVDPSQSGSSMVVYQDGTTSMVETSYIFANGGSSDVLRCTGQIRPVQTGVFRFDANCGISFVMLMYLQNDGTLAYNDPANKTREWKKTG